MSNKIWLIADTHFYHRNVIRYCDRPFRDVAEMNRVLVANWNKVVKKQDVVFMLGDFALSGKDNVIEIGQQLNGRKTLILGNHDGASKTTYYAAGFEYVSKYPIVLDDWFILSHHPKFTENNGLFINIYGHVHNESAYKDYSTDSFCVSAERIDYTPIDFEVVKETINKERQCYV